MAWRGRFLTGLAAAALGGLALAQPAPAPIPPPPAAPAAAATPPNRYLSDEQLPDGVQILPPAPQPGTPRYELDRRIFRETRRLQRDNAPRWSMAVSDAGASIATMYGTFSCALGVQLTPQSAPRLTRLLSTVYRERSLAVNSAKDRLQRLRPFHIDRGTICVPESHATSWDYPSGHASWGWIMGLVLAELAPDRATAILQRARAYGESRVVCGVHNASAIEAGRTMASAVLAAQHGSAAFRADLEAARQELAAIRAPAEAGPDPAACQAESALTARTPY
jgi:acid phosphatase (class A)